MTTLSSETSLCLLTQQLLRCQSITPLDAGVMDIIENILTSLGFVCHRVTFEGVENLYAKLGTKEPHLCFLGHTDVVPPVASFATTSCEPSLQEEWIHPPFEGTLTENKDLYGRGAVDMKGAIACFIEAVRVFLSPSMHEMFLQGEKGSLSFLLTSDEEGSGEYGIKKMIPWLQEKGEKFTLCLVGEPTSVNKVGDMIKVGRRGSLSAVISMTGKTGHVAYPHLAANPCTKMIELLHRLLTKSNALDSIGGEFSNTSLPQSLFDPSHLEITSIDVGNMTSNMIPSHITAHLNIRFNPVHTSESLKRWIETQAQNIQEEGLGESCSPFNLKIKFTETGNAFYNPNASYTTLLSDCIENTLGIRPICSTSGGTSDARFMKELCPTLECGLTNALAHHVNEKVSLEDLNNLSSIYINFITSFFNSEF